MSDKYRDFCTLNRSHLFFSNDSEIKIQLDNLGLKHTYDIDECIKKVTLEDSKIATSLEKMTTSNIAKLDYVKIDDATDSTNNNQLIVEHILLSNTVNNFVQNDSKLDFNLKTKLLLRAMNKSKEQSAKNKSSLSQDDKENFIKSKDIISRNTEPINEFNRNDLLFLHSFPLLFLLGEGWYKTGSAKPDFILHLLRQYDHRFGRDQRFYLLYLFYILLINIFNLLDLFLHY